ncbi:MAG TPA: hypothetical protein VJ847_11785 [Gemmatimonadales bacterium]|jgi:hypothetical protein|nr:hypothetical protein [Gemmatimonadales bacterium]
MSRSGIVARARLAAALAAAALACGGDHGTEPSGPVPGVLTLELVTPRSDDGAILLTVSGGPVASIEAAGSGYQLFSVIPDTLTARVLVTGDLAAGALLRLHVADTRRAAAYRASVAQAASRDTFAQQPLAGYALRVVPPASE